MKRLSIFVVDDDPAVLRSHARILSKSHSVTASMDAEDLIDALRSGYAYDAILSDVDMPGMSGRDLFDALSQEFPEYLSRIVFVTGGASSETLGHLLSAKVLQKPVVPAELLLAVQSVGGR